MQTIQASKDQFQTDVRSKVSINSISPDNVADIGDTCALLALERGLYILASTAGFATLAGTEAQIALVENNGIFKWTSSGGAANGTTIFDGPGGSKWTRVLQTNVPGGGIALNDLTDVTITGANPGDTLTLNGSSEWVNSTPPVGGIIYPGLAIMSLIALTENMIRIVFNRPVQYSSSAGLIVNIPAVNTIAGITGTGTDTIDLILVTNMTPSTVITLSYDGSGDLRDLDNNELPNTPSPLAVVNAIEGGGGSGPDTTPPEIQSGLVLSPRFVRMVWSEPWFYTDDTGLSIGSPTNNPIVNIEGEGTDTMDIEVTNDINVGDAVYFSYSSTLGDLEDLSGNEVITVTNYPVLNLLTSPPGGGGSLEGDI
jgi:hypothetical protein